MRNQPVPWAWIRTRILDEYRKYVKYPDLDWADIAAAKIHATMITTRSEKISAETIRGLRLARKRGVRLGRPTGSYDKKPRKTQGYYDRYRSTTQ